MLVDMIGVMTNLITCVEIYGKMGTFIFVLIDLKREVEEGIIIVMKAKDVSRMHS